MDSTSLCINSSNTAEEDLNAYFSEASASSASAPYTNYGGLFTANGGDFTRAETSLESDLLTGLTWEDYLLVTEGLLDVAPSFGALGVSNINASSVPPTPNFGAESAGINMPVGFPTLNHAAGNTGIDMPGAPPTFDFTTGSTNVNVLVGSQIFDLSAEITGINVPGGTQTPIEHPSYLGYVNGGFLNGTSQQVRQPINGVHDPLALPNTSLNASSNTSPETQSPPKRPNPPSARRTTPQRRRRRERAPFPAPMPNTYSNNSSNTSPETRSPPKRRRSSSPSARPPSKRRREEPTIRFVHDERSMPANFRANPDNHGRFQYTATGRRRYLNGPGAVQERRRRREGNQGASQQGASQ